MIIWLLVPWQEIPTPIIFDATSKPVVGFQIPLSHEVKLTAFNLHFAPFSIIKNVDPNCMLLAFACIEFITISQLIPDAFAK